MTTTRTFHYIRLQSIFDKRNKRVIVFTRRTFLNSFFRFRFSATPFFIILITSPKLDVSLDNVSTLGIRLILN